MTGWKNSSTTFCALESSEGGQASEGTTGAFEWELTPGLLGVAPCRLCCLLWDPAGDLNSLQVKIIATARPATAPIERISWYQLYYNDDYWKSHAPKQRPKQYFDLVCYITCLKEITSSRYSSLGMQILVIRNFYGKQHIIFKHPN